MIVSVGGWGCVRVCVLTVQVFPVATPATPAPSSPAPSGLPVFPAQGSCSRLLVRAREGGWGPSTEAGLTLTRVTPHTSLFPIFTL